MKIEKRKIWLTFSLILISVIARVGCFLTSASYEFFKWKLVAFDLGGVFTAFFLEFWEP